MVQIVIGYKAGAADAERDGLRPLHHLLSNFAGLRFVEIILLWVINLLQHFILFHFRCLQRLCQPLEQGLLALGALIYTLILKILTLVEFEQLLKTISMNCVLTFVQEHAVFLAFYPPSAFAAKAR